MYADGPGAPVALVGQLASTAHCAVNAKHSSWGLVSAGCRAVSRRSRVLRVTDTVTASASLCRALFALQRH